MSTQSIAIPSDVIAAFCQRNQIRKLSLFGSVLTPRFGPDSDVDVLVEFEAEAEPTLLTMARMERELSEVVGRRVDLRTAGELSRDFRDEVVAQAARQYERV